MMEATDRDHHLGRRECSQVGVDDVAPWSATDPVDGDPLPERRADEARVFLDVLDERPS